LTFPFFFLQNKTLAYQPENYTRLRRSITGHQEQSCYESLQTLDYSVDRLSLAFPNGK